MAMLEKEGFKFTNYIDIFDGAPSMEAEVTSLKTVNSTQRLEVKVTEASKRTTNSKMSLIATLSQPFYAMVAETEQQNKTVIISRDTAQALNVSSGDTVLLSDI